MRYNEPRKSDRNFDKIYALYKNDVSTEDIIKSMPHMARFQVLDIIQTIFGQEQVNKEKQRARAHF